MISPAFHTRPDGRRIAYRHTKGAGPTLVFLPGYMSDMAGSKATAIFEWARTQRRACLLPDYSGCGESPGEFTQGTLSRWRDEVVALVETVNILTVVPALLAIILFAGLVAVARVGRSRPRRGGGGIGCGLRVAGQPGQHHVGRELVRVAAPAVAASGPC